jgi:hypothetical protein
LRIAVLFDNIPLLTKQRELNMETIKSHGNDTVFNTIEDFVKAVNTARRSFKGTWYCFVGTVAGKAVKLKAYGKWLQVLDINGIRHGDSTGQPTVKDFKEKLTNSLNYCAS